MRLEKFLKDKGRSDWQKQRPFLSGNDRSRWCTVRALVEHGTYAIDEIVNQPNWDTIDMVKHDEFGNAAPEPEEGHLYSSKPTLLPTLMAGEYWLIHKATGATLGEHPYAIGRAMILTINVVPMLVYFLVLSKLVERFGLTDWGRLFVFGCATFATFLSTFAVSINNHLIAAVSAAIALHAALVIWYGGETRLRWHALAGLFAAFTAANELPALAFFAAVTVGLLWKSPRGTLLAYLPAALLVAAASMGTNYLAHHSWQPAYAHRSADKAGGNWYDYQFVRDGKVRDSYWSRLEKRSPIDQGEPDRAIYALHVLVGHHGIFSLTPVWLFALVGAAMLCFRREPDSRLGPADRRRLGGLPCVLLDASAGRPQLRRHEQRLPLGVLVRALMADRHAARRRRRIDPRLVTRPGLSAARRLGALRHLSNLEPLDPSLAVGLSIEPRCRQARHALRARTRKASHPSPLTPPSSLLLPTVPLPARAAASRQRAAPRR